jgi:Sulfotransferase family
LTESVEISEPLAARALPADPVGTERDGSEPSPPFANHVQQRTIVLPEQRVLFLPMPRAGCTAVLWLLARLAGIQEDAFARSAGSEVSPALTVHDTAIWGDGRRLADYEGEERLRVLGEDGWLRFTLVRHPGPRLWSAWLSKLLLREPDFFAAFGEEPWFPRKPESPAGLVEDFRRFVAALPGGGAEDVHWAVQSRLAAQLPLTHVGRVERLDETLALLDTHVSAELARTEPRYENRSPLTAPPHAYDAAALEVLHSVFEEDFEEYGYEPQTTSEDGPAAAEWERVVVPLVPALRDTVDRHERIAQLQKLARRVPALEKKLETKSMRQGGRLLSPILTNIEERADLNVRWGWAQELRHGFTAVLRVKNEARPLPWVLPPLLRAVDRVVVVDNGSTDGTATVARRVAAEEGAADRLEVLSYPIPIARCGEEHLGTSPWSIHSLAYFYNWSFAHVRTTYALKWDGDMVLADAAVAAFRELAWQLEAAEAVVKIPRYPLYVADDRHAFLDLGLANCEPWGWPNRPGYGFVKALEWEQPVLPPSIPRLVLPAWSCVELKHLDADEFDHWSDTDFDASSRTQRKRREWEVFNALARGGDPPDDVVAIESPPDRHVVDFVRSDWLRAEAGAQPGLGERMIRRLARV